MGQPQPPYGPQYGHGYAFPHPPPPDPPELPAAATAQPRWPWWYGPAGLGIGVFLTFFTVSILALVLVSAGVAEVEEIEDAKGYILAGTIIQQAIFAGVAIYFASRVERPRAWHFGLRPARFWPTIGWAALGLFAYWTLAIVYVAAVRPDEEQETLESLGTDEGLGWLVAAAVLVIVLAPLAEEFFFRGFFYRTLRTSLPVIAAAVLVGVLFGVIHLGGTPPVLIPPLVILGVVFCLVYEKTGTLFATIGLHALNNVIAFGVQTEEWAVAGAVGGAMIAVCLAVPRFLPRVGASAAAPAAGRT
jgi:membrane protease YdiL (CAAX protease family)